MLADSAVTYTSVHSKARSWSIPSEDPYEEAAKKLLEQAPCSPEYVPDPMELEDHVPVYIPEPEHPEDLVPAKDEAPIEAYIIEVASTPLPPPSFLPSLIQPPRTRAAMAQMRAAAPSTYHPLLPSGTPPLLPIPLPAPSTSIVKAFIAYLAYSVFQLFQADSAVTYTSVHSEARSWSIPSEDPYEEAARQLLEQAPLPAEDEAPIEAYIIEVASAPPPPPSFLPSLIRPPRTRAAMAQMRAAAPSTYHPLLPSGTPPLLPIPLPTPSTSRRADIPEADTPPRKRLLLTAPRPGCEVGESSAAAARQPGPTMARRVDCSSIDTVETRVRDTERRMMAALKVVNLRKDRSAVRAEIEVLRRERLAYEQESIETRQALARSEAYSRALEARITVLETQARRLEWQRQDADDRATRHIMRIQALEAGARDDTLEDTASRRTMATVNQEMSVEEIEQIVAQRVANAIEAISIYESINQTKQREKKVVGNASNKRKWEGDQNGSPNQQQNKEHKVFRAHSVGPNYKKEYLGSLPLCNKCKFHHIGLCAARTLQKGLPTSEVSKPCGKVLEGKGSWGL
ncbi:hypothetical protein Tco_1117615 [Tanacetum coccineum]